MNNLMNFNYNGHTVTTIIDDKGNPWWIAKEVCRILGIRNISRALKYLDNNEKITIIRSEVGLKPGVDINIVNEDGLSGLILMSTREIEADDFEDFLNEEVLPAIHKTVGYIHDEKEMTKVEFFAEALLIAQSIIEERDKKIKELEMVIDKSLHMPTDKAN
ncbi:MAG: BRO family protein [Desulfobacteraceae bacterium]|jgi:anti-repressor protein